MIVLLRSRLGFCFCVRLFDPSIWEFRLHQRCELWTVSISMVASAVSIIAWALSLWAVYPFQIMICPLMQAVTYIDEHKNFRTFKLDLLAKFGCNTELYCRLKYAKDMVERIMTMKSASASSVKSATGSTTGSAVAAHWETIFTSTTPDIWWARSSTKCRT